MGEVNSGARAARGLIIDDERACNDCGYELRGLRLDGRCPECGTPISPATTAHSARPCTGCGFDVDGLKPGEACPRCGEVLRAAMPFGRTIALGEAPRPWLGRLRTGCVLMALGGFAYSALPALIFFWSAGDGIRGFFDNLTAPEAQGAGTLRPVAHGAILVGLSLVLSVGWAGGVWLVTRPRPRETYPGEAYDPNAEWLALRWVARGGATLGPVSAFLLGRWIDSGSWTAASLWFLLATLGVAPAMAYLSGLLFWARDDGLAWATRGAMSLVGVTGAILVVAPLPTAKPLQVLGLLTALVFVLGVAFGQWASFRMGASIRWSVKHAADAAAAEERRRRKAEAERARLESKAGPGTALSREQVEMLESLERREREAEAPAGPARTGGAPPGRRPGVERPAGIEAFGLEDDNADPGGRR